MSASDLRVAADQMAQLAEQAEEDDGTRHLVAGMRHAAKILDAWAKAKAPARAATVEERAEKLLRALAAPCPHCSGSGVSHFTEQCDYCDGDGRTRMTWDDVLKLVRGGTAIRADVIKALAAGGAIEKVGGPGGGRRGYAITDKGIACAIALTQEAT